MDIYIQTGFTVPSCYWLNFLLKVNKQTDWRHKVKHIKHSGPVVSMDPVGDETREATA